MSLDERLFCDDKNSTTTTTDSVSKSIVVTLISAAIIGGNVICLIVLNSRCTRGYFMESARMLMTSLACTDCTMGLTVTALCIYPALYNCWPYGKTVCKLQALFISSLFHESTLSLTLVAVDRYISIFHPLRYRLLVTRHKVIAAIVVSWMICFTVYGTTVFGFDQFYYDDIGINCEPFYQNPSITASVMSLFYFIPAVIMLVCYLRILTVATQQKPGGATQAGKQSRPALEMRKHYGRCSQESLKTSIHAASMGSRRSLNLKAAKTLGLITIGFFVAVTPWTVTQLLMALGDVKVHPLLDFSVTWLALSNSFWNVIIYCVTSTSFRLAAGRLFSRKQTEARRCAIHQPRVELLATRSTMLDSLEHIACNGNTQEEWRGKNGVHVNGYGRCNPDSCNNGSDSWRRTQRPSCSAVHQCKRLHSDVPHSVNHSCHGCDHDVIFPFEEDIVSQDSFHLSRTHRRKSSMLQDCLCNRTESAPNIPEIEVFPLDSITKTGHSGINVCSSDSSGSDTIVQSD
ncbi:beta-3 adrenergic receptor-like [Haliotis cracherodii]|uniref:beta-3 adrenergic receptor-like n=1 Tax=Haliotis cracherodii TaxID=6455 RepID=UPI0039EB7F70